MAGELLERLGSEGAPLAEGLLLRLGEMCAGASDAAEEGMGEEGSHKVPLAAQNALGQAIRSMGPQPVLQVLPLGLVEVRRRLVPHSEVNTRCAVCCLCPLAVPVLSWLLHYKRYP